MGAFKELHPNMDPDCLDLHFHLPKVAAAGSRSWRRGQMMRTFGLRNAAWRLGMRTEIVRRGSCRMGNMTVVRDDLQYLG